jgi:hypothetical protein
MEAKILKDNFQYDREYYLSLNRNDKSNFTKNTINKIVKEINNPSLIDINMAPNENIIYHLYSDGTITREKGSWAYGKRSVTDIESYCIKPNTFFSFPYKGQYEGDTYAILTLENCRKVKNLMNELLLET